MYLLINSDQVNQNLTTSIEQIKAMAYVEKNTAPMTRLQSFGLMTSAMILAGIYSGQIPDTVGQRFNLTSYSDWAKARIMYYVEQSGIAEKTILAQTPYLPVETVLLVNERLFGEASLIPLRLNLINEFSFKKSMYYDFFNSPPAAYMASWPVILSRIYWVQNYETYERVQYMDSRQPVSISKAVGQITNEVSTQIVVFCSLVVLASAVYFYFFSKLQLQCRNYIGLLRYLDASEVQAKLLKNAHCESILRELQRHSIEDMRVDYGDCIMVEVNDLVYQFIRGNILRNEARALEEVVTSAKEKREIAKEPIAKRDVCGWLPMLVLLGLALVFFLEAMFSNIQLGKALENYFKVSMSVSSLELGEIATLYIAS